MPNIPDVYHQQFEYDEADPPGYRAGVAGVGRAAGGKDIVIKEFEIRRARPCAPTTTSTRRSGSWCSRATPPCAPPTASNQPRAVP